MSIRFKVISDKNLLTGSECTIIIPGMSRPDKHILRGDSTCANDIPE